MSECMAAQLHLTLDTAKMTLSYFISKVVYRTFDTVKILPAQFISKEAAHLKY